VLNVRCFATARIYVATKFPKMAGVPENAKMQENRSRSGVISGWRWTDVVWFVRAENISLDVQS